MQQPVLDPNPKNGQKTLIAILGAMLAITVVIAVIATLASP
ncbi:SGM_5486 family transporter-associated protein [Streptomyces olivoreticuli]|nr:SGM_5486 family transporter-associated protein [Streptomyces olivoreticuli]